MLENKLEYYLVAPENCPKPRKDGRLRHKLNLGPDIFTGKPIVKQVYGYNLRELNYNIAEIYKKYASINFNSISVEEYLKWYIKQRKAALTSKDGLPTIEYYEILFNTHVIPVLGQIPLTDLAAPSIRDMINAIKPKHKRYTGQRTKEGVYIAFKAALKFAVLNELILINPMDKIEKPKYKSKIKGVVDADLFNKFLSVAAEDGPQWPLFLEFALFSGVRRGELAALTFSCIDYKKSTVTINKAFKRIKAGTFVGSVKSDYGFRTLLMPLRIMQILKKQEMNTKRACFAAQIPFTRDLPMWHDEELKPIKLDLLTRKFTAYREKLNIPEDANITLHSLRHTLATYMAEQDINPKKIQIRLGHSSPAFTMQRYTNNTISMQESVIDTIDKII